jgi:hypothetical protein
MRACELLIRVHDNESSKQGLSIGAVISVCNVRWPWSQTERTAPFWRLVRMVGVTKDEVEQILAAVPIEGEDQRSFLHIELAHLDPEFVADDSRARPMLVVKYDGKADKRFFDVRRRKVKESRSNLQNSIRTHLAGDRA